MGWASKLAPGAQGNKKPCDTLVISSRAQFSVMLPFPISCINWHTHMHVLRQKLLLINVHSRFRRTCLFPLPPLAHNSWCIQNTVSKLTSLLLGIRFRDAWWQPDCSVRSGRFCSQIRKVMWEWVGHLLLKWTLVSSYFTLYNAKNKQWLLSWG